MPKKLSTTAQRALLKALPAVRKMAVKKVCQMCEQRGEGMKDITKKARVALGPVAEEIGPLVMREFILPMLMKKITGKSSGNGLRLAGQRISGMGKKKKRGRPRKKT